MHTRHGTIAGTSIEKLFGQVPVELDPEQLAYLGADNLSRNNAKVSGVLFDK
jgi:hypothetical protein